MLAARLHAYGEKIRLDDVDEPKVDGPQDVIIRVAGAGLCRTDLHIAEGMLQQAFAVKLPYTLGHENAGWVDDIGDAVTSVSLGDVVIVHPAMTCGRCSACHRGCDMYCTASASPGFDIDGGFAPYLRTSERALVRLPDGIDPMSVAPYADAGLAAYRAVKKAVAGLRPDDAVAVVGIGGLGHIAVQLLHTLTSVRVVAVDTSTSGRSLAQDVGADAVLHGGEGAAAAVREWADGDGVAAVVDFVGEGSVPSQAIDMLAKGGSYYVVGYGGGLQVPTAELVAREISVVGNLVGTYSELEELMALVTAGRLRLESTAYPLTDIDAAMEDLAAGEIRGRAVIVPEPRTPPHRTAPGQ